MAANKTTENKDKLQDVLKSLQSIISSCGGECQVDKLQKEYSELIGSPVPFRQFNHGTLASFLQGFPEVFVCTNRGGQLFVRQKDDKTAPHIAKLTRQQKTATRKIKGRPKPARRPGPSSWTPPQSTRNIRREIDQNWREPFRPIQMMGHPAPRQRNIKNGKPVGNPSAFPPRRPDIRPAAKSPPPNKPKSPPPNNAKVPTVIKPKTPPPSNPKSPPPSNPKSPPPLKSKSPPLINVRPPLLPTPPTPPLIPVTKINPSALYYNDGNFCFPRAIRDNQEKQFAPYFEVPPRFKKTDNKPVVKTCKQKLEEEMKRRGFQQDLVFRSIPCGKKKQHWVSVVQIKGVSVSSYPQEYQQAQDAEEEVARKALELLETQENTSLPITRDLMVSMDRVKKIMCTQTSDLVWLEHVQELYKKEFKEVLPDNWVTEVKEYNEARSVTCGLLVDNPVPKRWIVQLKEQETQSILKQHLTHSEPFGEDPSVLYENVKQHILQAQGNRSENHHLHNQITGANGDPFNIVMDGLIDMKLEGEDAEPLPRLPSLELPMTKYWDIYVTYIEDLRSIHFRLIGDNYSTAYDELVTEMELHYMEEKNMTPVMQPKNGGIYAAAHDESWCRVKVIKIIGSEVTVQFLDHGDQENISISQLHELHEKFFKLPAQGVCCSLAGLEYACRDQSALSLLQKLALGNTLVAQVVSRNDSVSLILYNTLTDDDVNINEKVSEQIEKNFVEPTLPSVGGVVEVYLMHTTSSGDVYVQIETETYKILLSLLDIARSRTQEILGKDVDIDLTRLYLARFSEDGEWYRAVPRRNVDPDGKVLMWFVDFGNSDHVPTSCIRPLELTDKLTKIPHQALLCRLHNVPSSEGHRWTSRTCQRMFELVSVDSPLLLKVHANGTNVAPPQVELFKRLHPKNELVSINATLSMDESLFSHCDGDSNNNSLQKEVILSPSRMRNRIGSYDLISGPSSARASSPLNVSKRYQQPGSLLPMDLPAVGEFFDVYITYAASPSNFAVQSWKMTPKVSALMDDMATYYSNPDNLQQLTDIKGERYYAVKHTDNLWYRAYLTTVREGIITGLFVDFGDCFIVSQECVQPLPSVFHGLPCQAIKAKLSGVVAANLDWRPEDSFRFKELVEYRELVSVVTGIEREIETEEMVLLLRLVDTSDLKLDIYVDDLLVKENRAIKVNE